MSFEFFENNKTNSNVTNNKKTPLFHKIRTQLFHKGLQDQVNTGKAITDDQIADAVKKGEVMNESQIQIQNDAIKNIRKRFANDEAGCRNAIAEYLTRNRKI